MYGRRHSECSTVDVISILVDRLPPVSYREVLPGPPGVHYEQSVLEGAHWVTGDSA